MLHHREEEQEWSEGERSCGEQTSCVWLWVGEGERSCGEQTSCVWLWVGEGGRSCGEQTSCVWLWVGEGERSCGEQTSCVWLWVGGWSLHVAGFHVHYRIISKIYCLSTRTGLYLY